jgi:hypothetical protein
MDLLTFSDPIRIHQALARGITFPTLRKRIDAGLIRSGVFAGTLVISAGDVDRVVADLDRRRPLRHCTGRRARVPG